MFAHVIVRQIGMISLYAVVEYRDDDVFAGVSFLPGRTHIHVETVQGAAVLKRNTKTNYVPMDLRRALRVRTVPRNVKWV